MYLMAAGTLLAASSMQMSSRCGLIFWPNAPPVSRAITRMRFSGTASSRAANIRRSWGDCDAAHTVSSWSARDHSTTMPRVSIGDATYAC